MHQYKSQKNTAATPPGVSKQPQGRLTQLLTCAMAVSLLVFAGLPQAGAQLAPADFSYGTAVLVAGKAVNLLPAQLPAGTTTTTIPQNTSIPQPIAVALDAAKNIYVVGDQLERTIKIFTAASGYQTITSVSPGLGQIDEMTADKAGNIYVLTQTGTLSEIAAAGGYTTVTTLGGGYVFSPPLGSQGLCVDNAGNVYVADAGHQKVVRVIAAGGYKTVTSLAGTYFIPEGVAINAAGNVFVADNPETQIDEVVQAFTNQNNFLKIGSSVARPVAVAADAANNIYVLQQRVAQVEEMTAASNYQTANLFGTGTIAPIAIALDAANNMYVVDAGDRTIKKITGTSGVATGYSITPALPAGLMFNTTTGAITGTPTAGMPATPYTVTATNSTGTATTSFNITVVINPPGGFSYNNNNTFVKGKAVTPLAPVPAGGNSIYELRDFTPNLGYPNADYHYTIATDNAHNLFFSIIQDALVGRIPAGQPEIATRDNIDWLNGYSGQNTSAAVDGAGNFFLLTNNNYISENTAASGYTNPVQFYSQAASNLTAIAADASGNLFVNQGTSVREVFPGPAASKTYAAESDNAVFTGLVVDGLDNLYLLKAGRAVKVTPGNQYALGTATDVSGGFVNADLIGADVAGNVYLTNHTADSSVIFEVQAGAGYKTYTRVGAVPRWIDNMTVDAAGNIFTVGYDGYEITGPGGPATYSTSPALPTGLTIDAATGIIRGAPAAVTGNSIYYVIATNTAGTSNTSFSITVNDTTPVITYPVLQYSFQQGVPVVAITPASTAGAPVSYSINPTLPAGLNFNTATGVITGTPAGIVAPAPYNVTATNITGTSAPCTLQIGTVAHAPGYFSYTGTVFTNTHFGQSQPAQPVAGTIVTIDAATNAAGPTLVAVNTAGSVFAVSGLGVQKIVAGTATGQAAVYTRGVTSIAEDAAGNLFVFDPLQNAVNKITAASGYTTFNRVLTSASVGGLAVDGAGNLYVTQKPIPGAQIKGSLVKLSAASGYTTVTAVVTGFNSPGAVAVDMAGNVYVADYLGIGLAPGVTTVKQVTSASGYTAINPLATGFSYNAGIAVDVSGNVYVADNSNGLKKLAVTATGYNSAPVTGVTGTISGVAVDAAGDVYVANGSVQVIAAPGSTPGSGHNTYIISPTSLPPGLTFIASTGNIQGVPTALVPAAQYTVTATSSGGSAASGVTLTVNDVAPAITYTGSPFTFVKGTPVLQAAATTPTSSGGAVITYSTSGLPAGLNLNPSTGAIYGTPSAVTGQAAYSVTAANSGGSTPVRVTITVNDIAPAINYSGSPFTFVKGTPVPQAAATTPVSSGGAVITYSTSGLPAGLSISSSTGAIYGTPSAVTGQASYTVTATNSGGNTTALVTITVNDITPAITYTGSPFTFVKGTPVPQAAATTPVSTGGAVTSYGIATGTTLPAGLNLNSSTGAIYGTPSAVTVPATYSVTATNNGGSAPALVTITVNDIAPAITYTGSPFTFVKGTPVLQAAATTPVSSGGAVTSYSLTAGATLPAGLSLSPSGAIYGTPSAVTGQTSYPVTATNSGGSTTAQITITVNDIAPAITYTGSPFTFVKGTPVLQAAATTPVSSGGAVTSYGISTGTMLPAGLRLNPSSGAIYGTPSAITGQAFYPVTASNSGGFTSDTLSITVNDAPPAINYPGSPYKYAVGTVVSLAAVSTGGTVTGCYTIPSLPGGLTINTACAISGTVNGVTVGRNYGVTAANSGGRFTDSIYITLNDKAPAVTYPGIPFTFVKGIFQSAPAPVLSAGSGVVISYHVNPALPAGLALDTTRGIISGTAQALMGQTVYTVTAANSGGNDAVTVPLKVIDQAPVITYAGSPFVFVKNTVVPGGAATTPASTGGTVLTYTISPLLPHGLYFNGGTGTINGTPTAVTAQAQYVVTANNNSGVGADTIIITVNDTIPVINYAGSPFTFTKNTASTTGAPSVSGGTPTGYSFNPPIPGLSIGANGAVSGIPTAISTATRYGVTATYAGGSVTDSITVTVNDRAPVVMYAAAFNFVVGTTVSAAPASTGGAVVSYSITPALPAGLLIDSVSGIIHGIPTAGSPVTPYTVTATNSGGVTTSNFTIAVGTYAPGNFSYSTPDAFAPGQTVSLSPVFVQPGTITTLGQGFTSPYGIAVDDSTNVYVADNSSNLVQKLSAASGYTTKTMVGTATSFNAPTGVAVDTAGNVYVADNGNNTVDKIVKATGIVSYNIGSGYEGPQGVAVDAAGNVDIADIGSNAVKQYVPATGKVTKLGPNPTVFNFPEGVAVDGAGNVYVADYGDSAVKRIAAAGGYTQVSTLGRPPGFTNPAGIAVDAQGIIYVADPGSSTVKEITSASGITKITQLGSGFLNPAGVAVDAAGNVYVADDNNGAVKMISAAGGAATSYSITPQLPAGLLFSTQTGLISGQASATHVQTIYTVTATNAAGSSSARVAITITNSKAIPSVTVAVNPGTGICAGTVVTLTATPVNGGLSPIYQWQKNGVNVGANSTVYTDNTLNGGDTVKVIMTSNATNVNSSHNPAISATVTFTQNVSISSIPVPVSTCGNGSDGTVYIQVNSGAYPFVYKLITPGGDTLQQANSASFVGFSGIATGTYQTSVTDITGCSANNNGIVVAPAGPIQLYGQPTAATGCSSNGAVTAGITGGVWPFAVTLTGPGGFAASINNDSVSNIVFSNLAAGKYTETVTDGAGCTGTPIFVTVARTGTCSSGVPQVAQTGRPGDVKAVEGYGLKVTVMPNPATSEFHLLLTGGDSHKAVEVRVMDMYGKTVYHTTGTVFDQYTFGGNLAGGMYIAQVVNGNGVQTLKLVKGQ